ncbi:MAG: SpoIVB peptidase [Clostridiales bacterium]|nr:SpoIVB peptidase [Clostridiales bacterium]
MNFSPKKLLSLTCSFVASMALCFGLVTTASVQVDSAAVLPAQEAAALKQPVKMLVPGGEAFGVKVYANGVMVVGLSDINTAEGVKSPAYAAGIRTKDVITAVNGDPINTVERIADILSGCGGSPITVTVSRKGVFFDATLMPALSTDNQYRIGLWVRDSTAGIGTLTFYDPETGCFGGLGHAICDIDTGEVVPIDSGTVVGAKVVDVKRGQKGEAGELVGIFDEEIRFGKLYQNCEVGIFGMADSPLVIERQAVPIAGKYEVREGPATIICSASGLPEEYRITINKVMLNSGVAGKSMAIQVTDERLIALTGGIVQGMSGSPILQKGKLVGAVTHVMLGDPTKGYGIFIETMLKEVR